MPAPSLSSTEFYSPERLHREPSGPETGLPILLLHGWGSSASMMRPIAQAFEDTYRIYNIDLPGHGNSPPPSSPWGVPEHAELIATFIQDFIPNAENLTLIGHSNGGRIGLFMASHNPYRHIFGRMVLISPSGVEPQRKPATRLKTGIARAFKAPFQLLPSPFRDFTLDWLRHSLVWKALGSSDYRKLEGVMRDTFVKTVGFHLDDDLHQIDIPVLIFRGSEETAVTQRQVDIMEERIPDAGVVLLDGADHYGYLDAPDVFISATRHFLRATVPSTHS